MWIWNKKWSVLFKISKLPFTPPKRGGGEGGTYSVGVEWFFWKPWIRIFLFSVHCLPFEIFVRSETFGIHKNKLKSRVKCIILLFYSGQVISNFLIIKTIVFRQTESTQQMLFAPINSSFFIQYMLLCVKCTSGCLALYMLTTPEFPITLVR